MPVFDTLQRASFLGIEFPVKRVHIRGNYRKHEHEYLRVPGAVNEKLERGLYTVEMEAVFDTNIKGYGAGLWPYSLQDLRVAFEGGITGPLVIPTIGTIPAFQTEWDQTAEMAKIRSGESCRLSFLEDQTEEFLTAAVFQADVVSAKSSSDKFALQLNELGIKDSIFDDVQNAVNGVLAIRDQGNLYGGLIAAKVAQATVIFREADATAEALKNPINHELVSAFAELWDAIVTFGKNLAERPMGPRLYTVPRQMSVSDISTALYGDSSRANELLLNNDLDDPFAVQAGTQIIYFIG